MDYDEREQFHVGYLTIMGNLAGNAIFVCAAVFILRNKELISHVPSNALRGFSNQPMSLDQPQLPTTPLSRFK